MLTHRIFVMRAFRVEEVFAGFLIQHSYWVVNLYVEMVE